MYLDHQFSQPSALGSGPTHAVQPGLSMLTDLERTSIAIGYVEARRIGWDCFANRSLLWRKTMGRVLRLLGVRLLRPLADDRLELLRLYTCIRRRAHGSAEDVAARLEVAGMTRLALLEVAQRLDRDHVQG